MKTRKLLLLCVGAKVFVLLLCLSMIGASLLVGQIWFKEEKVVSFNDIQDELRRSSKSVDLNARNKSGDTGVMAAVKDGDVRLVELLLRYGADPNLIHPDGETTALHFAIYNGDHQDSWKTEEGERGFIQLLVDYGADPRIADEEKRTPLHLVQEIDDRSVRLAVAEFLVETVVKLGGSKKEYVNAQNEDGNTIMHLATSGNDAPWIAKLTKASFFCDIDITIKNEDEETPLEASPTQEVSDAFRIFGYDHKNCEKKR